jgi:hypothetical protein
MKYKLLNFPGSAWFNYQLGIIFSISPTKDDQWVYVALKDRTMLRKKDWIQEQIELGNIEPVKKLINLPDWF